MPSKSEAQASRATADRGADREADDAAAQLGVVGAGEDEEGDVEDAEDADRQREGEAEVAEGLRHAERGDQHRRHRGEDHQPDRALLGVDHAGQPGVADPGPPEHAEHEQALDHPLPGRVVGHQRRALGDREDEDEVEEELQRGHPLALAAGGAQPRGGVVRTSASTPAILATRPGRPPRRRRRPPGAAGPKTQSRIAE